EQPLQPAARDLRIARGGRRAVHRALDHLPLLRVQREGTHHQARRDRLDLRPGSLRLHRGRRSRRDQRADDRGDLEHPLRSALARRVLRHRGRRERRRDHHQQLAELRPRAAQALRARQPRARRRHGPRRAGARVSSTTVYGADRAELTRRIGTLAQLARIDRFVEEEGPARGARRIRIVTGGGLEIDIHPDRALDLGQVTYRGVPVAWMSPTGMVAPGLTESRGQEWLRSFGGGLLATCGLDSFGPPTVDDGVEYPQHGRVGVVPATLTPAELVGDEFIVAGTVRQTGVFGENLVLERTWTAPLGGSVLRLRDVVRNEGSADSGHMVL